MTLLDKSVGTIAESSGILGQAIHSIINVLRDDNRKVNENLVSGFYKKQYVEVYYKDKTGRQHTRVIENYIIRQHTSKQSSFGTCKKVLWNADMNEIAYGGYKYA